MNDLVEENEEFITLDNKITDLSNISDKLKALGGINKELALEALAIDPDFNGGRSTAFYSKDTPSVVGLSSALESITVAILAILAAAVAALILYIRKAINTVKKAIKDKIDSQSDIDAIAKEVAKAESTLKEAIHNTPDTPTDFYRKYIIEKSIEGYHRLERFNSMLVSRNYLINGVFKNEAIFSNSAILNIGHQMAELTKVAGNNVANLEAFLRGPAPDEWIIPQQTSYYAEVDKYSGEILRLTNEAKETTRTPAEALDFLDRHDLKKDIEVLKNVIDIQLIGFEKFMEQLESVEEHMHSGNSNFNEQNALMARNILSDARHAIRANLDINKRLETLLILKTNLLEIKEETLQVAIKALSIKK